MGEAHYTYRRNGIDWTQDSYIKSSNSRGLDIFGEALVLSGNTMAVASPGEDSTATGVGGDQTNRSAADSGAVYVFTRTSDGWVQEAYVKASNTEIGDVFGRKLALWGDFLAVGALGEDSDSTNPEDNRAAQSGAAYLYSRTNGQWSHIAYIKAPNTEADDQFGGQLAIGGGSLIIGAIGEDSAAVGFDGDDTDNSSQSSGAIYLYR